MGVLRRLVQEEVLHDDAFHRRQRGGHMLGVGIGLRDVLALDVEALEAAVDRRVEHVGDAQARLALRARTPQACSNMLAHGVVGDVAVAGELVRERAHVAGALHVVLAAQRIHADAVAADIAGRHGEVGHAHHHRRALAVLGDAEAVVDRRIAAGGVEPGGGAQLGRRHAGDRLRRLRRILRRGDETRASVLNVLGVAALGDIGLVDQAFGDDDMRRCALMIATLVPGPKLQMMLGLDMRRVHQVDAARVDDDQLGALAQPPLHARGEHRMGVGRVGADHQDHVGLRRPNRSPACRPRCRRWS